MKTYDLNEDKVEYFSYSEPFDITLNIKGKTKIFLYAFNTSGNIVINLDKEDANIEIHYSIINIDNNTLKIKINHNHSNTTSNIYNHGINTKEGSLMFDVTGYVPKNSQKCVVNQENQIINLTNGNGIIKPNLLIDNYDVTSSHAAYIGNFKEDKLYYLMSRGISKNVAIKLLMKSIIINSGNEEINIVKEMLSKIDNL